MTRLLLLCISLSACSSIVSDPCAHGYIWDGNGCTTMSAGEMLPLSDNGNFDPNRIEVLPVDPLVCELPAQKCGTECKLLDSDPLNCGHCGHACASGICSTGACVGDLPGHVVAIGHDYATSVPAMDRVIANAVDMGGSTAVRVGWWAGTATASGAPAAVSRGLAQTARSASATALSGDIDAGQLESLDAIVIEAQTGDGDAAEAAGMRASAALATFLSNNHVVVVLETAGGVSYRYAQGAGLFSTGAPVVASGTQVTVVAPADEVAQGVVSPYLAKAASVGWAGVASPVVVDGSGNAVVFHAVW